MIGRRPMFARETPAAMAPDARREIALAWLTGKV
jgi:hypothetical protein